MGTMIGLTINGEFKQMNEGLTLSELLSQLEINRQHVAVEVNTELVPRERHAVRKLSDGDEVEIVTLVGGG